MSHERFGTGFGAKHVVISPVLEVRSCNCNLLRLKETSGTEEPITSEDTNVTKCIMNDIQESWFDSLEFNAQLCALHVNFWVLVCSIFQLFELLLEFGSFIDFQSKTYHLGRNFNEKVLMILVYNSTLRVKIIWMALV